MAKIHPETGDLNEHEIAYFAKDSTDLTVLVIARMAAELLKYKRDMKEAATSFLVPCPEPGTDMSKVICANRILRGSTESDAESMRGLVMSNNQLQKDIHLAQLQAEKRNRELDALHYVWCDGGCAKGVHRYCGSPEDITEEVVSIAEKQAARLRAWWEARNVKQGGGK